MNVPFNLKEALHNVKHYLPTQAPLKDFIHHNTLHAFQHLSFNEALKQASQLLGYKTYLSLSDYREKFLTGEINSSLLDNAILQAKGEDKLNEWKEKLVSKNFDETISASTGKFRKLWSEKRQINLSKHTHPLLFRLISS